MVRDRIEKLGRSTVQHGKGSDRIYLMKLHPGEKPDIVLRLHKLAEREEYTKIFAKIPAGSADAFLAEGFSREASVPGMYSGREDGLFLARFLDPERARARDAEEIRRVLDLCEARKDAKKVKTAHNGISIRTMNESDAEFMAELYDRVFDSYPFPIHDPNFIVETMRSHVLYFGAFEGQSLLALSSAEMDRSAKNVEMTDFATLPRVRSRGLAGLLLKKMEDTMREQGFFTAYTIARAVSCGMNLAFARAGYRQGGTLINNTNIAGGLESMNVWHKPLTTF